MSIYDEIARHVEAGVLHPIEPLGKDATARHMYVATDIWNLLEGPWESRTIERRAGRLRANLISFVKGDVIGVSLKPHEHEDAFMGLLAEPKHQVWDIRSRDPKPGLRVFGRFADTDAFIGFTWRPRSKDWASRKPLGGHYLEWEFEKIECEKQWNSLFPNHPPKNGEHLREFISEKAFLVGA